MALPLVVCLCMCGCGLFGRSANPGGVVKEPDVPVVGEPRIRPGIVLMIQVSYTVAQKPTSMEVQVDQNGEVTLPYLLQKPVQCNGLTLDEFKQKLIAEYKVYLRQPVVTVNYVFDSTSGVSPYGTVLVMGEVVSPGPINLPATRDLTVTKVIKLAGGTKPFADKRNIKVTSFDGNGNKTTKVVSLYDIGKRGDIDKDITLHAGDVVYVDETVW